MNKPGEHGPTFQEQPGRPSTGRTEASGMMGTVKEKAQDLASGAAGVASQVKEKVQEFGSSVAHGAQRAWEGTRDQAREWAHEGAEMAENAWEGLGDLIRRHPVPSLLIALGVGFVLGGGLGFAGRRSWS